MLGKKLTVYLANGLPSGIRHVEIANWSGQGIACPRSRLKDLSDWPEATRPGVYFLLEKDSGDTGDRVYIGESEDVQRRLKDHFRNKDFWNEAVLFTSKDDNLTKSHIMYLESRLTQMGISAGRFEVEAGKIPTKASLPRADRDAMEEFLLNVHIVLGALGHRVLESVNPSNLNEAKATTRQILPVINFSSVFATLRQLAGLLMRALSYWPVQMCQEQPQKVCPARRLRLETAGSLKAYWKSQAVTTSLKLIKS